MTISMFKEHSGNVLQQVTENEVGENIWKWFYSVVSKLTCGLGIFCCFGDFFVVVVDGGFF